LTIPLHLGPDSVDSVVSTFFKANTNLQRKKKIISVFPWRNFGRDHAWRQQAGKSSKMCQEGVGGSGQTRANSYRTAVCFADNLPPTHAQSFGQKKVLQRWHKWRKHVKHFFKSNQWSAAHPLEALQLVLSGQSLPNSQKYSTKEKYHKEFPNQLKKSTHFFWTTKFTSWAGQVLHQLTDLSMNFLKEVLNGENFSLSDYSLK
jgi:hypothetical protein